MFALPTWARTLALATAIQTAAATASWGQVHHLPGSVPGGLSGSAEAAAIMHFAQILKLFDHNGNGTLDPNEFALVKSGLGHLLGQAGNAAGAAGNQPANLLPLFDRNGNGQLDTAELQMAQMMMAMLMANYSRPVTGVPMAMPMQFPQGQLNPPPQPAKRGRRKRAERIADFAKAKNAAPAPMPAAAPKKKVKARAPMVERDQRQGAKGVKAGAANAPATD